MLRRSLLVAIALVVVVGESAVARPGPIRVESKAEKVGPDKQAIATAKCDGAQKALGGGSRRLIKTPQSPTIPLIPAAM